MNGLAYQLSGASVAILLLFAVAVAVIAYSRGRNPLGWFVLGFFLGCVGLVLVLVLPDLNELRRKEEADRREKERLREQLSQERMKNQAFRGHVSERLDQHDRALGVDTRSGAPQAELPPAPPSPPLSSISLPQTGWYLAAVGGQPDGPHDLQTVAARLRAGQWNAGTLVWHASMTDWKALRDTPLEELL